jgi:hypothetical protein
MKRESPIVHRKKRKFDQPLRHLVALSTIQQETGAGETGTRLIVHRA